MKLNSNSFLNDFSWYFLGSFIPLFIGFIKTPIFTRHFNKADYGNLGLVTITFTFFGMFLFSWIGSCIWRFYNRYKNKNNLKVLYSNLIFIYLIALTLLFVISFYWYVNAKQPLIKQLVLFSFFQLFLNQLFLFYMVIVRLEGASKFYTIVQSLKALISVVITLVMVFYFDLSIAALVSSLILVDVLFIVFLKFYNPVLVKIDLKLINKKALSELILYGSMGLILNVSLLTINFSDRYIIAWFGNVEEVGIYDQVYKISQLSVVALATIFFNSVNPYLLKELEINFSNSKKLIQRYIKVFLIVGLPIVFYLSLFAKDISNILLGKEFRVGYTIMPFIFVSAYLHGISNFYELRLKFSNKLKKLGLIALSIALLNIVLNLFFIGWYGYKWAAYTTLISYFILVVALHFMDREIIKFSKKNITFVLRIIFILALQGVFYSLINTRFELNLILNFCLGILFLSIYILLLKKNLLAIKI
ncbi:MAG: oligosaccharide flippase family protein [Flavobacteriaceae bacterium]|nr:oligosaccharide flippase family protein [Flavobacteriaceae bacterium]